MLDFGALPPEINSARMYAGPGSAPMMAAAAAWRGLAAELATAASRYQSVIAQLAGEEWLGSASASMAAAAAPHIGWLTGTGTQAEQAAARATDAAAAYEAAFAATVPPALVAANRVQLAALVATNVLGQNTAAIAATEAHYAQMWAQDAGAMYGYAASSAAASTVTPFSAPTDTPSPAGAAGQTAAAAAGNNAQVAQLISSMPNALQGLSAPIGAGQAAAQGLGGMLSGLSDAGSSSMVSVVANGVSSGAATAVCYIPSTLIPSMVGYLTGPGFNAIGGGVGGSGLGALLAPGGPLSNLGALGGSGLGGVSGMSWTAPAVSAGQASLVGSSLSVPPSWAGSTPASTAPAALQASSWAAAPESSSVTAMPGGMPGGGSGRGSFGFGTPRYGFKPTVMPRPVMVG